MNFKTKIGQLFQLAIITSSLMGSSAWAELSQVGGVYQIGSAQDLKDFADLVNTTIGNATNGNAFNAELTTDINLNESENNQWNPIGSLYTTGWLIKQTTKATTYAGSFNGNGHTISGLHFENTSTENVGLFGYINSAAKIYDVHLENSSISGKTNVGGICGYNNGGTITNCSYAGTVTSSDQYAGGICGNNVSGTITGCSNTGTIKSTASNKNVYEGGRLRL